MGRTNISAGRMAREPSVPKPVPVQPPPPPTTGGSTPSSPSPPSSTPETTIAPPPFPPQHTSSPPYKPDTQNRANKPRPKPEPEPQPVSTRARPLTLRSGKKIAPPLTGAQAKVAKPQPKSPLTLARTRLLTLRSGKKIVPPLTRAQAKLGVPDNTLTVVNLPSSPDQPDCEEAESNPPEPPAINPSVTDHAAPLDIDCPAPKRKKVAMVASGPPDYTPLSHMQLQNSPKCDNAVKTKPTQEKEAITKPQQQRARIVECCPPDLCLVLLPVLLPVTL